MERFMVTLLLFVILGSAYCEFPDSCQFRAFTSCRNPSTETVFLYMNGRLPDEAFLKENCDPLNEQLACLLEYAKICPVPDPIFAEPPERYRGLPGLKKLVNDICDEDSSLRKDYLQSVDCLEEYANEIGKDLNEIDIVFRRFNRLYLMENEENIVDDKMAVCVKLPFIYNEIKSILEKHCGPAASNAFVVMANHVAVIESDECLRDQEKFDRLTELLESSRSTDENIDFNSIA